jgi:HEAT repeat protein
MVMCFKSLTSTVQFALALLLVGYTNISSAIDTATFRTRALQAATKVRPESAEPVQKLIDALFGEHALDDPIAAVANVHGDEPVVAVFKEALSHDEVDFRCLAAEKLGDLGFSSRSAVPALITALRDSDEHVRNRAASALGDIGPEAAAAVPAFLASLRNDVEEWHVKSTASEALGKINVQPKEVVPALILALRDPDSHVRFMTVEALGQYGVQAAAAALPLREAVLHDGNSSVRWHGTGPLAKVDPEGTIAIPTLMQALKNDDDSLRTFAARAIGKFGEKAQDAAPLLHANLRDKHIRSRIAAAEALWRVSGNVKDTVPVLIRAIEQEPKPLVDQLWAANALATIGPAAKDAVPALRGLLKKLHWPHAPAHALGNIGPDAEAAVPDLLEMLESKNGQDRAHAAAALWQINRHPLGLPTLLAELRDPVDGSAYGAIVAAGEIGPPAKDAVPDLVKALSTRILYERRAAREALEKIDPAVLRALQ